MLYISVAGVVGTPRLKFWPPQQQCSPVLWSATNNIKARPSRWAVQRSVNPAGRSVPLSDDDSSNYISRYDGSLKGSDVLALANELAGEHTDCTRAAQPNDYFREQRILFHSYAPEVIPTPNT